MGRLPLPLAVALVALALQQAPSVSSAVLRRHICEANPWHVSIIDDLKPFMLVTKAAVDEAERLVSSVWGGGWRIVLLDGKIYLKPLKNERTLIKHVGLHIKVLTPQLQVILRAFRGIPAANLPDADFILNTGKSWADAFSYT